MIEILIAFFIILELKVIRDIILFRPERSWLIKLPEWFFEWLIKSCAFGVKSHSSFDGFHLSDAGIILMAWILSWYFWTGDWVPGILLYPIFWIIFYQAFNFQYHWLYMLPEYRERWLFR